MNGAKEKRQASAQMSLGYLESKRVAFFFFLFSNTLLYRVQM